MVESTDPKLLEVLDGAEADLVAVEKPERVHPTSRGMGAVLARSQQIADTRDVAATLRTLARVRGLRVTEMSAGQWRRALCGKGVRGTPGDQHVKQAVELVTVNLPRRTSTHLRDALGLAVVVLWGVGAR